MSSNEVDIVLALSAFNRGQFSSVSRAAATYNVSKSTLLRRLNGVDARRDCEPNRKKLTKLEEEVVIGHVLDLASRGFPASLEYVRYMANKLLAARGAEPVGKLWPHNFVKRTKSLTTCFARPYDRQRALCEDPAEIEGWYERVQRVKAEQGIADEDTYNFDEAGFMMGKITRRYIVTGTEIRKEQKQLQPGNREWVTLIQGINAMGWAIPPYLIFASRYHYAAWYEDEEIPRDWKLAVSDNGWTTNEHGVAWLRHFIKHTDGRLVGARRMLIMDNHESHKSDNFQRLCEEHDIYTICMPPHSSHLL